MATRLNPYLSFDGDAKQAMEFYRDVFGGDLTTHTYGEYGADRDGAHADRIMHALLETHAGFTLMGADTRPGMEHAPGNAYAVSVSGDDDAELRGYWEKLSSGSTVEVPLEKQMWGDVFGMCRDRFGVSWMVNITAPQN
ncbi:VOC family protein [Streptomyces sp. C10-9-1]|uniref:VOC family protein n=1 Tax=Streptomyces sp. C10-9-1 TaxID=1859285 RepID=UPI002113236E|nr:VOC family protein [Streptomyces sp. C10-9-1]MCQ6553691.1 VOC family protein [Streptomyces sp. C10-9-1]